MKYGFGWEKISHLAQNLAQNNFLYIFRMQKHINCSQIAPFIPQSTHIGALMFLLLAPSYFSFSVLPLTEQCIRMPALMFHIGYFYKLIMSGAYDKTLMIDKSKFIFLKKKIKLGRSQNWHRYLMFTCTSIWKVRQTWFLPVMIR